MRQTIYVDSLDTARFTCPECNQEKTMQLSEYNLKKYRTHVNCTCRCGCTYGVILEKSPDSAQKTSLKGRFVSRGVHRCSGTMKIEKLNSKGIMLRTNLEQDILPGLKLFLEFTLDDKKKSIIKKEVVVRAKKGKYLSAEFTTEEHYDSLGPYLFFNKLYV